MELREIYTIAKHQLESIANSESPDFRLEQAEFNKKDKVWEIIVSYLVENTNKGNSPFAAAMGGQDLPYERIYKSVKINENKEVIGFFIYEK